MEIETKGLGAGSYPEPPEKEEKEKHIKGTVTVTYDIDTYVPIEYEDEEIIDYIKSDPDEYIFWDEYKEIEVEVD